ncbi:cyclic nucleotide-binding domain-containing protein [Flammeovirga pectinis]|uniref:Cyclic nucleotide-binding domain-containing protein n=1 Tax=Flammeovirga pectinis TaxID=2494373 RepID=A0A3Q9FR99_9BACT|nr:cyclic nucleotide-binding domain-containing protein [Flammeovirga pectinis]AZQ64145.1 cyclic nucleotide-binding domain-containing protein [Flammeovirga pectinis]
MNIIASRIYYYLPKKNIFSKLSQFLNKDNSNWLSLFFAAEGAAIAIAFSVTYTLLFKERAVDNLPFAFMFSGVSILLIARLFAYLERRLRVEHLNAVYSLLKILTAILIGYLSIGKPDYLGILSLIVCVKALIFFEDCTYWAIVEHIYSNPNEMKAFDKAKSFKIVFKLTGFLIVLVGSKFASIQAMSLWVAPIYVIAGWGLWQVLSSDKVKKRLEKYHDTVTRPSRKFTPESFWAFGITNPYVFKLGLLTFCIASVWAIVEFFFMIDLRMTLYTPTKGIYALALLLIISYAIVSVVQPFLNARKLQDIGIKKLLQFTPIVLLIIVSCTYLFIKFSPSKVPIFLALVAIAFIFTRHVIFSTITPSLLRPIQSKHRGFTFGILRGFFSSIGLFFAGVLLWIIDVDRPFEEGQIILWILVSLLLLWWLAAKIVSRDYRVIIRRAFLLRDMESYEIATHDKEVSRLLASKLTSKLPEDIIYALEANTVINPKKNEAIILHMLRHPDSAIRYFSIDFSQNNLTEKVADTIKNIALYDEDPKVRKKAIVSTCKYDPTFIHQVIDWIDDKEDEIKKGALYGLLSSESEEQRNIALNYIKASVKSEDIHTSLFALEVLAKVSPLESEPYIFDALLSSDDLLIEKSIEVAAIVKSPTHLPLLISLLKESKFNDTILRTLIIYGEDCLDIIENELFVNKRREDIYLITLCKALGKIDAPKSYEILWLLVDYPWPFMRMAAYNALKRLKYRPKCKSDFDLLNKHLERFFSNYYWLCNAIYVLKHEKPFRAMLSKALNEELVLIEENIRTIQEFLIVGKGEQLYRKTDSEQKQLDISDQESLLQNAEIEKNLWKTMPSSIYQKLIIVLGYYDLEAKMQKLGDYYSSNLVDPLSITLGIIRPFSYNRPLFNTWTKITALISVRDSMSPSLLKYIGQILNKDNIKLIEPALISLKRIEDYQDIAVSKVLDELVTPDRKKWLMGILNEGTKPLLELEKVILLKSTNLFRETPEHVLVDIASIMHEVRIPRDSTIFRKGEESKEMYIIYEGEVKLHDGNFTFSNLMNRDLFGDLSILDSSPRTLSATTTKDSVLLRIEQDDFLALMGYRRSLMQGIMKVLGQRIRNKEHNFTNFTKEKM